MDYGSWYIEKLSVNEDKARNSLLVIDFSIYEMVNFRDKLNIIEEGKELHSHKTIRTNDKTPIPQMSYDIFNRDFKIDELIKNREKCSNDVSNIKRHQYKLKDILKKAEKLEIEQSLV